MSALDFTKRLAQIETGEEVFVERVMNHAGGYCISYADGDYRIRYADGVRRLCRSDGSAYRAGDRNIRQATPEDIARWLAGEGA